MPEPAARKVACDVCRHADYRGLKRFGLMVDGQITAERDLCRACLDLVLTVLGTAMRPLAKERPRGG